MDNGGGEGVYTIDVENVQIIIKNTLKRKNVTKINQP